MASYRFLQCLGKALLNAAGGGVLGDVLVDVMPDVARKAWNAWSKDVDADERVEQLESLARASAARLKEEIAEVVADVAAGQPARLRQDLTTFLAQVPGTLRQTFRRPGDPNGKTMPPTLRLRGPDDLLALLPGRLPRFKAGAKPFQGVDLVLEELLGVGGFGEVWKARNSRIEGMPPVALKFCLDESARDRLLAHEAKVLAHVIKHGKHPGIVELQNTFLDNETPCLQYEYVAGGDLTGHLNELHSSEAPPTPHDIAAIILQLCDIVAHAHKMRPAIVHRDLKPANILVQRTKKGVTFKIADFGIGGLAASQALHATRQGRTTHATLMTSALRGAHTPLYSSPQQAEGADPDPRDDVFSLGVIWYQALLGDLSAGRPGGSRWAERLEEKRVPRAHVTLLGQCFEDQPEDRPPNAAALADALRAALEKKDKPTTKVVVTPKKRPAEEDAEDDTPEAPRRKPLLLAGAGAAVLLLVGLIVALSGPRAEPEVEKPAEVVAQEKAAEALARGEAALSRKEFDAAVTAFSEAVDTEQKLEAGHSGRARAHQEKQQFEQAFADWTKAIELNGKNVRSLEQRALVAYQLGRLDVVIADATRAFELVPLHLYSQPRPPVLGAEKPARLLQYRAVAYCYAGAFDKANADCTSGLGITGANADLYNLRGITNANQGNCLSALDDYDLALKHQSDLLAARVNRAVALCGMSRVYDSFVARRVAEWRLPPDYAWAFVDQFKPPAANRRGAAHVPNSPFGPSGPGGFGGIPGGGIGGRGGFGFGPGSFLGGGGQVLDVPLPTLTPPAVDALEPMPIAGPPLPVLGALAKLQPPVVRAGFGPVQGNVSPQDFNKLHGNLGDAVTALKELESVVEKWPRSLPAWLNLGWAAYVAGQYPQAKRAFERYLDLDGGATIGHYYRGLAELAVNDFFGADRSFSAALRGEPNYAWAWKDRALARAGLEQFKEAATDIAQASKLTPEPSVVLVYNRGLLARRGGDLDDASKQLAEATSLEASAPTLLARGLLVGANDPAQGILLLDAAIKLDSRNAAAFLFRARLHERRGDAGAARNDYESAAALDTRNSVVQRACAFARTQRKDATTAELDKAAETFTQLMLQEPKDLLLPLYRASALYRKGDATSLSAAERDCGNVLDATKNLNEAALLLRGFVRWAQNNKTRALTDFTEASKVNPQATLPHLMCANLHASANRFAEALKCCNEAVKIEEDRATTNAKYRKDPQPYIFRANCYTRLRTTVNYRNALKDIDEAIRLDPDNADSKKLRAQIVQALQ